MALLWLLPRRMLRRRTMGDAAAAAEKIRPVARACMAENNLVLFLYLSCGVLQMESTRK